MTESGRSLGIRADWGWEEFSVRLPVTDYSFWNEWIMKQKSCPESVVMAKDCRRFEPTSGSTSKRKWIPYSAALLEEFDAAASAWIFGLALEQPRILRGRHYWSLSWLPDDLREDKISSDDTELFPWWKRWLMSRIMAVSAEVSRLENTEIARLVSLSYLSACRDLALISVWSPTFLISLLKRLADQKEEVARVLERGEWGAELPMRAPKSSEAASLLRAWDGKIESAFLRALWPRLSVISAWESSHSRQWAAQVRELFPEAFFQPKGLWATEGVVTIPFGRRHPLAVTSHVYEFRCLESGKILAPWQLRAGQSLEPLLSTGSGLWRYATKDQVKVVDFLQGCPCLEFEGRMGGVDLVGEKLDVLVALQLLERIRERVGCLGVTLISQSPEAGAEIPLSGKKPHYAVLAAGKPELASKVSAIAEAFLCEFHHYQLARQLGQLDSCQAIVREDALDYYLKVVSGRSRIQGDVKVEPLVSIRC